MSVDREEMRRSIDRKTTEDLLDALHRRAAGEWRPEAYELMETILRERGVAVERALSALATAQTSDPNEDVELVPVARTFNPIDAQLIRCRLEQAGIPTFLADEGIASMHFGLGIAAGGVKVMVSAPDVALAQEELARPEATVALECPRCGSEQVDQKERLDRAGVVATTLLFNAPIPQRRRACTCGVCGNQWEQ